MTNESISDRAARRWAQRRPRRQTTTDVALDPAAQLLSDYEDAIVRHAVHSAIVYNPQTHATEAQHLLKSRELHAHVRLLRAELLAVLDEAFAEPGHGSTESD